MVQWFECQNHTALDALFQALRRIKDRAQDDDGVYQYLVEGLGRDDFMAWLGKDDKGTAAAATCSLDRDPRLGLYGFVGYAWVRPDCEAGPELMKMVERWVKGKGGGAVGMITSRNPIPFCKKYDFKIQRTFLAKGVA